MCERQVLVRGLKHPVNDKSTTAYILITMFAFMWARHVPQLIPFSDIPLDHGCLLITGKCFGTFSRCNKAGKCSTERNRIISHKINTHRWQGRTILYSVLAKPLLFWSAHMLLWQVGSSAVALVSNIQSNRWLCTGSAHPLPASKVEKFHHCRNYPTHTRWHVGQKNASDVPATATSKSCTNVHMPKPSTALRGARINVYNMRKLQSDSFGWRKIATTTTTKRTGWEN